MKTRLLILHLLHLLLLSHSPSSFMLFPNGLLIVLQLATTHVLVVGRHSTYWSVSGLYSGFWQWQHPFPLSLSPCIAALLMLFVVVLDVASIIYYFTLCRRWCTELNENRILSLARCHGNACTCFLTSQVIYEAIKLCKTAAPPRVMKYFHEILAALNWKCLKNLLVLLLFY